MGERSTKDGREKDDGDPFDFFWDELRFERIDVDASGAQANT